MTTTTTTERNCTDSGALRSVQIANFGPLIYSRAARAVSEGCLRNSQLSSLSYGLCVTLFFALTTSFPHASECSPQQMNSETKDGRSESNISLIAGPPLRAIQCAIKKTAGFARITLTTTVSGKSIRIVNSNLEPGRDHGSVTKCSLTSLP